MSRSPPQDRIASGTADVEPRAYYRRFAVQLNAVPTGRERGCTTVVGACAKKNERVAACMLHQERHELHRRASCISHRWWEFHAGTQRIVPIEPFAFGVLKMLALFRWPCSRCTHGVVEAALGLSRLPSNGPTHNVMAAVLGLRHLCT